MLKVTQNLMPLTAITARIRAVWFTESLHRTVVQVGARRLIFASRPDSGRVVNARSRWPDIVTDGDTRLTSWRRQVVFFPIERLA
jgi:hypothetical protein